MQNQEMITMPTLIGLHVNEARKTLSSMNIEFNIYDVSDNVYVTQQFPSGGVKLASNNVVSIFLDDEKHNGAISRNLESLVMPNLIGMSLREAINMSKSLQLSLTISGSGHIVSQSIREGEKISFQQRCMVVAR
jgi:beta-lactam-binding protein with PASTA domain